MRVTLNPVTVLIRKEDTWIPRERLTHPQGKGQQGLLEPAEARREARGGFSLGAFRRSTAYQYLDFRFLASRAGREKNIYYFKLWQPRK